ncbi:hypothetical protein [Kineosporia sp. NBRC 101731]|uniref:hypothetical protein n=1 Tax=Kineosporia sp. NBRC 101731 TaxID=3032199 RepID=UPI0024A1705E|nr:hypothetical protein [Kineosporia sp. NBRC 101731]GLY30403.1 hypothetical protein Kisp02_37680 [Kineosporia sp. NBRC 101731]
MSKEPERWHLTHAGHDHTVEISLKATTWMLRWTADGSEVAQKKTSDNTVVLDGKEHGAIRLKLPSMTGPARQVTLYPAAQPSGRAGHKARKAAADPADAPAGAAGQARLGIGGTDFVPEEGTRAAQREAWIREHPHQYAARRTVVAVAKVGVPLGIFWLLHRITWRPDVDLPDIDPPNIPWPQIHLPRIPWPDLPWPPVNLPDLPDLPDLPGWTQYVWPVLLAFFLAQAELRRRRQQDARRRAASPALDGAESKPANEKQPIASKPGESRPDENQAEQPTPDDAKILQACKVTPVVPAAGKKPS